MLNDTISFHITFDHLCILHGQIFTDVCYLVVLFLFVCLLSCYYCLNSLYILDISPEPDVWLKNIFSQSIVFSLNFLFCEETFQFYIIPLVFLDLSLLYFWFCVSCTLLIKILVKKQIIAHTSVVWVFPLCFLIVFQFLTCLNLQLNLIYMMISRSSFVLLHVDSSQFSLLCIEETVIVCSWHLCWKSTDHTCIRLFLDSLSCLICWYVKVRYRLFIAVQYSLKGNVLLFVFVPLRIALTGGFLFWLVPYEI